MPQPFVTDLTASMSKLTVIRVEPGHDEPEGEDQVTIAERPDGGFEFSGTIAIHAVDVVLGSATFISGAISTDGPFPTSEAAEAAAIEWAAEEGAETLYVLAGGNVALGDPQVIVQNTGYRGG